MKSQHTNTDISAASYIPCTSEEFISKINSVPADSSGDFMFELTGVEISDAKVANKRLLGGAFAYSKLSNVTFVNCNLSKSDFTHCDMHNVTFLRCRIPNSRFDFARFDNVRFIECDLMSGRWRFSSGTVEVKSASLCGLEMYHSSVEAVMENCSGEYIDMSYSPEISVNCRDCDFHNGHFTDSSISGSMVKCIFTKADFAGTYAEKLTFTECGMRDINLTGAIGIDLARNHAEDEDDDEEEDFEFDFKFNKIPF